MYYLTRTYVESTIASCVRGRVNAYGAQKVEVDIVQLGSQSL